MSARAAEPRTHPVVSVVVMAHPLRSTSATALARTLGPGTEVVYDPDPDGPPNALRTARRAWAHCPPGATHHMVVQDDVLPSPHLMPVVADAVAEDPGRILTLYANLASWNGAAARVAHLTGHTWITPTTQDYFPTLAVVMPCRAAHDFAAHAAVFGVDEERDDDQVLARFLAGENHRTALRVPNLVEHDSLPSISGYDHVGIRRAVCFQGDHEPQVPPRLLDAVPAWPHFAQRRAMLRMPSRRGRTRWQTMSRGAHLRQVGTTWEEVCRSARRARGELGPVPERRAAVKNFLREMWLAGHTLGWATAAAGGDAHEVTVRTPLRDAAVTSYIEAGLCYDNARERWAGQFDGLLDIVWRSVVHGMAAHGMAAHGTGGAASATTDTIGGPPRPPEPSPGRSL